MKWIKQKPGRYVLRDAAGGEIAGLSYYAGWSAWRTDINARLDLERVSVNAAKRAVREWLSA